MANGGSDGRIILKTAVDTAGIAKGLKGLTGIAKTTAKGILLIGGAITAVTGLAVKAYAEFEQLAGGAELMFGSAVDTVMKNAKQAYATVQMSQNEYLRQVNGFATGLKTSLGGNEQAAAELAHKIIVAEADIVAATGETQEAIQNAFNGIMKSNYMMLDNLKLGITPTKEGMQEVIDKVNAWKQANGEATKYQMGNLADMQSAIVDYVEMQGMAGYASREAAETIQGSTAMMKASWENLLIAMSTGEGLDDAINGFVYSLEKVVSNMGPIIESTLYGLAQAVQRALPMLVQTIANALIQQIPNLVVAVYNMIVGLFKGIVLGIKALFTGGTSKATEAVKQSLGGMSDNAKATATNMNKVAQETKKAGKEAKKSMASFDELNVLSSNKQGGAGDIDTEVPSVGVGSAGGGGGLLGEITKQSQEITEELNNIMAVAGACLVAIGLLLLFTGNIAWGAGFIITGAVTFSVAAANSEKFGISQEIIRTLETIMGIAGGALLALGIILLWIGGVVGMGVAIGMIITGAALVASAVATKAAFSPSDIQGWLTTILGIAGGALLALGIILCMVGSVPVGVGMIIAGSVAIVSAIALNYDEVASKITGWTAVIMGIVGGALLVLGIVLCCTGAALPLGIALIAVGAVALATPIALNWDAIKEKTVEIFNGILDWMKTWGLLVLGIILCITGVGIPLGIALIQKGAENLAEAQDPLWTAIVDKVKDVWDKIKTFWNTHIAKWFTKEHWAGLAKNMMNGLIEKIEAGLNKLLSKFHDSGIGEALDYIAGGLGFEIPRSISIPRLAKGAVIPPNREFMAVLGDQKQGVNIETPLATMIEAFEMSLANNGYSSGQNININFTGNLSQLARVLNPVIEVEKNRVGTRLVKGGAY